MSCFMVRDQILDLIRDHSVCLLRTKDDAVQSVVYLLGPNRRLLATSSQNRCFVQKIRQRRSGETRGTTGDRVELDIGRKRLAPRMHIKDGPAFSEIGKVDRDRAVKTARAKKRIVKNVHTIRCRNYNDASVAFEAIHFSEKLIQSLLALIITAASETTSAPPLTTNSVDFINKHNARGILLGLGKEITHSRSSDTNEHLHEL
mmetsp:Transcript_22074/g.37905  ORF Transcript_22074/g.37905 Transcript_22074/m.37905 type:complete len:203 (+) Transcript_22074:1000-1608(+)